MQSLVWQCRRPPYCCNHQRVPEQQRRQVLRKRLLRLEMLHWVTSATVDAIGKMKKKFSRGDCRADKWLDDVDCDRNSFDEYEGEQVDDSVKEWASDYPGFLNRFLSNEMMNGAPKSLAKRRMPNCTVLLLWSSLGMIMHGVFTVFRDLIFSFLALLASDYVFHVYPFHYQFLCYKWLNICFA